MYFRLTKHVFLHVGLLLLACFSFFTPASQLFWQTFFFAALHECFHLFTAFCLGVPMQRLTFLPYGCHLRLGRTDFVAEAKIAAAGPLGSFLLFFVFRHTAAGKINLLLCLVNLLPALPLDGGRICRLFLWKGMGVFHGNRILRYAGVLLALFFFFFGIKLPSLFCLSIAGLLLTEAFFVPSPIPLLQKKAQFPMVKIYCVHGSESLHILNRLYSPFYTIHFYVKDRKVYIAEKHVFRALQQTSALTFRELCNTVKNP